MGTGGLRYGNQDLGRTLTWYVIREAQDEQKTIDTSKHNKAAEQEHTKHHSLLRRCHFQPQHLLYWEAQDGQVAQEAGDSGEELDGEDGQACAFHPPLPQQIARTTLEDGDENARHTPRRGQGADDVSG